MPLFGQHDPNTASDTWLAPQAPTQGHESAAPAAQQTRGPGLRAETFAVTSRPPIKSAYDCKYRDDSLWMHQQQEHPDRRSLFKPVELFPNGYGTRKQRPHNGILARDG